MNGADAPTITVHADAASAQAASNARVWVRGEHLDGYAHRVLTPAEVLIFVRYRERLSGRVLDLGCIAEGVERPAQQERLKELGCDHAQGYLLARPMGPDALHELLRATAARMGGVG